jgi:hypothetical protein
MTKLLEKNKAFEWTKECQASFEELKKRLTSSSVLILPDLTKKFDGQVTYFIAPTSTLTHFQSMC